MIKYTANNNKLFMQSNDKDEWY